MTALYECPVTVERYAASLAHVERAETYRKKHAVTHRGGYSSLTAELASHADYATCTNDHRADVEVYRLFNERPECLTAYLGLPAKDGPLEVTTWSGRKLSSRVEEGRTYRNPRRSYTSPTLTPIRVVTIWGDTYTGRALGVGLYVHLRKVKSAKGST